MQVLETLKRNISGVSLEGLTTVVENYSIIDTVESELNLAL